MKANNKVLTICVLVFTVLIAVLFCIFIAHNTSESIGAPIINYPIDDAAYYDPYIQQFDAFNKGQLHLDVEPNAELLSLDNPYDYYQRKGIRHLWDRALYNGKYYSYFGITPIITVYEPYYIITGSLPSGTFVLSIFALLSCIFIPLLINEIRKRYCNNFSCIFQGIISLAAVGASFALLIERGVSQFYYIAMSAAIAFLSIFLFLLLRAIRSEKHSGILYCLTGISYALLFHSRVNTAVIPGIIAIIFVVAYFIKNNCKFTNDFIKNILCLGIPAIFGIAISLIYNYLRFDSPFEFGTTYQLTIADVSEYSLNIKGFIPSLYHGFLQSFNLINHFPYIEMHPTDINLIEYACYVDQGLGAFAFPFNALMMFTPLVIIISKIKTADKIGLFACFAGVFAINFINYCLGGVIFRYTADFALICALLAVAVIIILSNHNNKIIKILSVVSGSVISIFSLYITAMIPFVENYNLASFIGNNI